MGNTSLLYFACDLRNDPEVIALYEKHHQSVWPEILESIRGQGITNMEIYRTGNRLFMVMEVDESFDPKQKAQADFANPKVPDWENLMSTFQQQLPWASKGEKWIELEKIFSLND